MRKSPSVPQGERGQQENSPRSARKRLRTHNKEGEKSPRMESSREDSEEKNETNERYEFGKKSTSGTRGSTSKVSDMAAPLSEVSTHNKQDEAAQNTDKVGPCEVTGYNTRTSHISHKATGRLITYVVCDLHT